MLAWGEARAAEIAADHSADQTRWSSSEIWDADERAAGLLQRNGYAPVHPFFDMVRPDLEDIPAADLPEGFEIRPVDRSWLHDIFVADAKAFRDHWGSIEEDEATFGGSSRTTGPTRRCSSSPSRATRSPAPS